MLVQGAGLPLVVERAGVLGNSVRELMANDIYRCSEIVEKITAVAEDQLADRRIPDYTC